MCQLLHDAGAKLIVTDVNDDRVSQVVKRFNAKPVPLENIYEAEADVFAPCAVGGILTFEVIGRLKVSIVAGGANNQLPSDAEGDLLYDRGILYAPDFVANGGGIINVAAEILKIENREAWVAEKLQALNDSLQ